MGLPTLFHSSHHARSAVKARMARLTTPKSRVWGLSAPSTLGREERPGKGTVNCPDTTVPGPRKGKGQAFRDPVLRNHKGCCREGPWPSTQCTHGPTYTHANGQTHTQPEASTAGSCSTFGQKLKGPLDARRLWQGALCQLLPPSRQRSEADRVGHKGSTWAWSRSSQ